MAQFGQIYTYRPQSRPQLAQCQVQSRHVRGSNQIVFARGDTLLQIEDLQAKIVATDQPVLNGVSMTVREGEVHTIMGKNGSGKSTLSKVLVGHPDYVVTGGRVSFKGQDLLELEAEDRARAGVFLSFQSPIEVPGVNNVDFLRMAYNAKRKANGEEDVDPLEFYSYLSPKLEALKMDPSFLNRNVNEGFSGGEKKRNEILQMAVLEPVLAILDEIDSGLDVDALKDVAQAVLSLKKEDNALMMVTHYRRLLEYLKPDIVHIMETGKIIRSGGMELVDQLEEFGYDAVAA